MCKALLSQALLLSISRNLTSAEYGFCNDALMSIASPSIYLSSRSSMISSDVWSSPDDDFFSLISLITLATSKAVVSSESYSIVCRLPCCRVLILRRHRRKRCSQWGCEEEFLFTAGRYISPFNDASFWFTIHPSHLFVCWYFFLVHTHVLYPLTMHL